MYYISGNATEYKFSQFSLLFFLDLTLCLLRAKPPISLGTANGPFKTDHKPDHGQSESPFCQENLTSICISESEDRKVNRTKVNQKTRRATSKEKERKNKNDPNHQTP